MMMMIMYRTQYRVVFKFAYIIKSVLYCKSNFCYIQTTFSFDVRKMEGGIYCVLFYSKTFIVVCLVQCFSETSSALLGYFACCRVATAAALSRTFKQSCNRNS